MRDDSANDLILCMVLADWECGLFRRCLRVQRMQECTSDFIQLLCLSPNQCIVYSRELLRQKCAIPDGQRSSAPSDTNGNGL